jgi:hypothetical protein
VEARGRDPRGETLEGGEGYERLGVWIPGNTGPCVRIRWVHQSLEPQRAVLWDDTRNGMRGSARREAWRLPAGELL